jgi:pyruvate,water dikinase
VLKHSSPQYIGAFQKASTVVVEKGNLTDHMSSVVREFNVPCVVRVPHIFSMLENGQEITVDAIGGIIYKGIIHEVLDTSATVKPVAINVERTESHGLLKKIAHLIFPLNLTDPWVPAFTEEACRTWHDMIRVCHETVLNEMFALKDKTRLGRIKNVYQVKTHLPLSLYVLNLFETAADKPDKKQIRPEAVLCEPFQSLWHGMIDFASSRQGLLEPASATGILATMSRTPAVENINYNTRSFVVVTPEYMNLNLSMGYHYIVLDSHLPEDPYLNHITISFKGGAADLHKRALRILLVARVLKKTGFTTSTNKDFLKARIKSEDAVTIRKCLYIVGKMLSMTRLLDLSLEDENTVDDLIKKFYKTASQRVNLTRSNSTRHPSWIFVLKVIATPVAGQSSAKSAPTLKKKEKSGAPSNLCGGEKKWILNFQKNNRTFGRLPGSLLWESLRISRRSATRRSPILPN